MSPEEIEKAWRIAVEDRARIKMLSDQMSAEIEKAKSVILILKEQNHDLLTKNFALTSELKAAKAKNGRKSVPAYHWLGAHAAQLASDEADANDS